MGVTNGPPADLIVPHGLSAGGPPRGDTAPDSLLAQLRNDVQRKRETRLVTVELPPIGTSRLRANYGVLQVEEIESYVEAADLANTPAMTANLETLARACRSIEALDADGSWLVLRDDVGPVTFDDRLARLLGWDRPGDEFRYSVREVYEGMFGGDGFAVMAHQAKALRELGLVDREAVPDLARTAKQSTRSVTR
jgi:hypothetical protein